MVTGNKNLSPYSKLGSDDCRKTHFAISIETKIFNENM